MTQDRAREIIAGMKASIKRNNFFGLSPEDQKVLLAHIAAVEAERDELRDSISSLNQHALPALSLLAERLERERDELAKALEEVRDHPEKYDDGKRSYAVGWAFWNVQNIARAALVRLKGNSND